MRFLLLLLPRLFGGLAPRPPVVERDFSVYFRARQLCGSFLLFDPQANRYTAYNAARCCQGFLPASTFKIPNTLIGSETGVIRDTSQVFKWDGVRRSTSVSSPAVASSRSRFWPSWAC